MERDKNRSDSDIADLSERMIGVEVGVAALNEKFDIGIAALNEKVDAREAFQRERNHVILNSIATLDARGQKRGADSSTAMASLQKQLLEKKEADDSLRLTYGIRALMFLGAMVMALISFIYLNDIGHIGHNR